MFLNKVGDVMTYYNDSSTKDSIYVALSGAIES